MSRELLTVSGRRWLATSHLIGST